MTTSDVGPHRVPASADELRAKVGEVLGRQRLARSSTRTGSTSSRAPPATSSGSTSTPSARRTGPFGATIAHGLAHRVPAAACCCSRSIASSRRWRSTTGSIRIRFTSPVMVGSRVRAVATLAGGGREGAGAAAHHQHRRSRSTAATSRRWSPRRWAGTSCEDSRRARRRHLLTLRTPVGRYGGMFKDVQRHHARRDRHQGGDRAHRARSRDASTTSSSASATRTARRRPSDASPRSTPACRSRCRAAARPPLRLGPAGGDLRRHAGPDRCLRRRARRRRREHEPGRVLLDRPSAGGRAASRSSSTTASPGPASPPAARTTRCRAACSRPPRTCVASTRSRARSRTSSRCARTSAPSRPSRPGAFDDEIVPVEVGGPEGHPHDASTRDEHPRADTTLESLGRLRPVLGRSRPRGDGHRRQRQRSERRRRDLPGHHPRDRRASSACARWSVSSAGASPACRRRPWASARSRPRRKALERAGLELRGHGPDRAQRGVRRAGARLHAGVGVRPRPTSTASTSTARASRSVTPSAPPAGASSPRCPRAAAPRGALRARDDVHRRRPGPGRGLRGRDVSDLPLAGIR